LKLGLRLGRLVASQLFQTRQLRVQLLGVSACRSANGQGQHEAEPGGTRGTAPAPIEIGSVTARRRQARIRIAAARKSLQWTSRSASEVAGAGSAGLSMLHGNALL
jgi:hypothetical protein